jgi:hypothetical protein
MATTYVPIATAISTGSASISFTSIPAIYTDLVFVCNLQAANSADIKVNVNNDTATNYSRVWLTGNGTTATSGKNNNLAWFQPNADGYVTNTMSQNTIIHFMNYSNTTTFKTFLSRAGNWEVGTDTIVGTYRSTSAINRIDIIPNGATYFSAGSTFSLYGIANAQASSKATGGNFVTTDGTYWYHTFTTSGTFTPTTAITADVLSIAGGGSSGGYDLGNNGLGTGGGGAGGLLALTAQSLITTAYTVTIGAGGAGVGNNLNGSNGSNSQFGALTAAVGGGGGARGAGGAGLAGGSGGGSSQNGTTAAGTAGQGNVGGAGDGSGSGGGGGGAGSAGVATSSNSGGNGGAGSSAYSSWLSSTGLGVSGAIAGGGGGAAYQTLGPGGTATGGGGRGRGSGGETASGVSNTGGGGGGISTATTSSSGGSGLVIVRYAV